MLDYTRDWVFPKADAFKVERELSDHVLGVLNTWLHVEEQVPGLYQGREPVRIDAVLRPRDTMAVEMMRLMGQFNVGELMPTRKHGWTLLRSGVPVWSEHMGVRHRFSLKPRTAARDQ
ncbi:hypothetical protein OHB35_25440 [Streptomyces phaeochromogenes]|uniref:Uncharacterized protein n=1 Tax=Streptomyces phaeochromogenes TaxID=1923 RepID=A0ABZ1HG93_STRPH|nr:hypothetical protein [Streptomyces phaeochromogenes]WSD16315.1 hypothetical protein OHB35_25440 [Streptomyces phaeochromogenes]